MTRLAQAWRALERERRLAALAALGLFISMLLPWYSKTDTFVQNNAARATQASLNAFQAFSFVEAAVLLVSAGVLAMLFVRAEGASFNLPGGDGTIVMVAGGWAALLIFYRLLDKPGLHGNQRITATVGVEWGIFIALLLALGLLYCGRRMRAEERPQPPLLRSRARPVPGSPSPDAQPVDETPGRESVPRTAGEALIAPVAARAPAAAPTSAPASSAAPRRSASARPRFPPAPAEQMSFEDPPSDGE